MKNLLYLTFFFVSISMTAQNNISEYQYAIVASKFDFLKKIDQHKTSSLTAFLLNKIGFKAFVDTDVLPPLINQDRCQFLFVDVQSDSGFFATKNSIQFKDCNGRLVYASIEGKSKKKEYAKAYHEAIRNAFKDPVIEGYQFKPKTNTATSTVSALITADNTSLQMEKVTNVKAKEVPAKTENKASNILYAQAIQNGFQLIDTKPKLVYTILETSTPKLYIMQNYNGILYLKDAVWIAEYYEAGKRVVRELNIKF